jgi:hypothetical protein|nr:MAG TPA_asm: hypothetical protein [Caudoviricetes sp.]
MNENIKESTVDKSKKLAEAISSLSEIEKEKLSYVVEGIKLATINKSA